MLFTCIKISWFFRNHLANFNQISHWSFCWNVIDSLFKWSCCIDCQAHIFFFKTKNCSNDDIFISCDDRIGKMLHNICMSAVAMSIRWANRGPWASCFLLILTIFYRVYYSHTLLQIVLWMWTAGIRVFVRCAIYPVCEIIQPCTTQCIARTIRKAKISCKTSMFKPSAQDFLTPFGTLQRYTTLFDSFTDFSFHFYATLNFFSIMVRLTDVQRGRAVALLMQGQRQQQIANHFGVNVSTIERLVRRLRETGHLADRTRSGSPRVTSMNGITSRCELSMLWLTLSKGELGQQRQQEGGTPDIDFQFDFDFKIWGGSYQWTSITRNLLITNQWNLELLFHTCTVL